MLSPQDFVTIGFLIFLEGILSIDNALVLAILARQVPLEQQKKVLTYGLMGAIIFRLISLFMVTQLLAWRWVKFVGGGYLLLLSLKHFFSKNESNSNETQTEHTTQKFSFWKTKPGSKAHFWKTVLIVELTDIAFAVDSILAAVALSNKFWVIFTGGVLGIIMMRFAATLFIKVLKKYPGFEITAYLLVGLIGIKVIIEGLKLPGVDFHSIRSPYFWIFWGLMLSCVLFGFKKDKVK